ncbi:helix-turn-helix domain-containing protein [Streptomyces sp. PSKA30]|uniref:helix-turn-helix domain-containing protein n=1 Tax=Streptomyces sp. PSKA30 TaxID=2874597 RepID=UPI001CD08EFB|nr:helix-turn-helix transcriptional regulator [Streptomyces sp. PSKA30]MBZ9641977.1 helix-turn-helix transcriptional regulator [Streptomyces sp. PSKA30]
MTATTSPSDSASPSEHHEPKTTRTGPAGSRAASRSSSTRSSHPGPTQGQRTADGAQPEAAVTERHIEHIKTELAHRLLDLRKERGWSVYDLEQRTGVSRSTLPRIERTVTEPTTSVLVKMCSAYGYTVSQLLAEIDTHQPDP